MYRIEWIAGAENHTVFNIKSYIVRAMNDEERQWKNGNRKQPR